jgi:hypothetical protein
VERRDRVASASSNTRLACSVVTPAGRPRVAFSCRCRSFEARSCSNGWASDFNVLGRWVRGPVDCGRPRSAEPRPFRSVSVPSTCGGQRRAGHVPITSFETGRVSGLRLQGRHSSSDSSPELGRSLRDHAGPPWRWRHRRGTRADADAFQAQKVLGNTFSQEAVMHRAQRVDVRRVRLFLTSSMVVHRRHDFSSAGSSRFSGNTEATVAGRLPNASILGRRCGHRRSPLKRRQHRGATRGLAVVSYR